MGPPAALLRHIPEGQAGHLARSQGDVMKTLIRAAAAAGALGLLLTPAAASAAGAPPAVRAAGLVRVQSGTTTVTTTRGTPAGQGLANLLIGNGIMPATSAPASQKLLDQVFLFRTPAPFSSRFRFSFPVAGGQIGPAARTGQVRLKGGLVFVNGKDEVVEIDHLVVDFTHRDVTGLVDDAIRVQGVHPKRIAVFTLDLSHTSGTGGGNRVEVDGIRVRFAGAAAKVLDHNLSTGVFRAGLAAGSASTVLVTAQAGQ
jgi:hypothetical protein